MYSYTDTVIIDIQFLLGKNKEYIIKELAILPSTHITPLYFLFKPPYTFFKLGKRIQFQNLYNYRYINALDWYCGNVDYSSIREVLAAFQSYTIIVKGHDKKVALMTYLPNTNIIDLSSADFCLEDHQDFTHNCPYHHSSFQRCAINNTFKIRRYMDQQKLFN